MGKVPQVGLRSGDPRRTAPFARIPRRAAAATARERLGASSLRRTAETWWPTVLRESTSASAMAASESPSPRSARTSSSRGVRPAGEPAGPARGPRGTGRPAAWRSRTMAARTAEAPRASTISSARRAESRSAAAARDSASQYGMPRARQASAAACHSFSSISRNGSGRRSGTGRRTPPTDSHQASSPSTHASGCSVEAVHARSTAASTSDDRPSSHACSACRHGDRHQPLGFLRRVGQLDRLAQPGVGVLSTAQGDLDDGGERGYAHDGRQVGQGEQLQSQLLRTIGLSSLC